MTASCSKDHLPNNGRSTCSKNLRMPAAKLAVLFNTQAKLKSIGSVAIVPHMRSNGRQNKSWNILYLKMNPTMPATPNKAISVKHPK